MMGIAFSMLFVGAAFIGFTVGGNNTWVGLCLTIGIYLIAAGALYGIILAIKDGITENMIARLFKKDHKLKQDIREPL